MLIRFPDGMLTAMRVRYYSEPVFDHPEIAPDAFLATAIEFLANHPLAPTDEEIHEFYSGESEAGVSFDFLRRFAVWWGRRMFTDQEPIPVRIEAAIRGTTLTRGQADQIIDLVNRCVPPEGK